MSPIARLSCIHLDTPALGASVDFYGRCFGLSVTAEEGGAVALAASADRHSTLVLRAGDCSRIAGLEFESGSVDRLDEARAGLGDIQADDTLAFPAEGALVLIDPDGTVLRVVVRDRPSDPVGGDHDRPEQMSHLVLNSPDPAAMVRFYTERLGFRVTDAYERNLLTFLRCDQPQHHCLGIAPGETAGLNHFAVDCGDIDALMRSVGRMKQAGYEPIWGPGRHGPGGNVFCYYADPIGLVAEFTCDVLQIEDDAAWSPSVWERTPANGNVWGTGGPSPEAVALMAGHLPKFRADA